LLPDDGAAARLGAGQDRSQSRRLRAHAGRAVVEGVPARHPAAQRAGAGGGLHPGVLADRRILRHAGHPGRHDSHDAGHPDRAADLRGLRLAVRRRHRRRAGPRGVRDQHALHAPARRPPLQERVVNRRLTGPGAWILYVVTAALMVFILAPLVVVIAMSVSDSYFVSFPPQGFTLKWYAQILQDRDFLAALKLSGLLALSTTIGSLLLGVPAAIALTRASFPGQTFLKGLVLSPLIFPALVTGLALMQLLSAMGSGDARINLLIGHIVVLSPCVHGAVAPHPAAGQLHPRRRGPHLGRDPAEDVLAHHLAADRPGRRGRGA